MKLQVFVVAVSVSVAQAYCPNYCSGHGECTENDICECFSGFGEPDCSLRTCPSGLSWVVGTDSELDSLPTPNSPAGKHPYTECSSRGSCDRSTGECECFEGYTGKACRRSACPNECSGHGLCVADGDVRSVLDGAGYYGGDVDFVLAPQKQYWNAKMSHQCLCDQQYTGYDCSTRVCPVGLDPTTSCDEAAAVNDIQAVTLFYGGDTELFELDNDSDGIADGSQDYLPENIEQFFTLTYTSQFNAQYETPPISYWDTGATVQQALTSLPNFAVSDVQVTKMFPRDVLTDAAGGGLCAKAYFNEFQSVQCVATSECEDMFPSLGEGNVICDMDIRACVETHTDHCMYQDGQTEFVDDDCAVNFEIDGIYRADEDYDTDGVAGGNDNVVDYFWGHRLTSFERNCQAGKFSSTDPKYAIACTSDQDCVPCAGFTQVTNGVCGDGGYCAAFNSKSGNTPALNGITSLVTPVTPGTLAGPELYCSLATFIIKFSDESTQGVQNDLVCTINNENSNSAGAAPMYTASKLAACEVTHIGVPEFSDGNIQDADASEESTVQNLLEFCIAITDDTLTTSMIASADCTDSGEDYDIAMSMAAINTQVQQDDGDVKSIEGDQYPTSPDFEYSLTVSVYTAEEITNADTLNFDTAMPCSNKGSCDYSSGICTCSDGYTGSACGTAISYV